MKEIKLPKYQNNVLELLTLLRVLDIHTIEKYYKPKVLDPKEFASDIEYMFDEELITLQYCTKLRTVGISITNRGIQYLKYNNILPSSFETTQKDLEVKSRVLAHFIANSRFNLQYLGVLKDKGFKTGIGFETPLLKKVNFRPDSVITAVRKLESGNETATMYCLLEIDMNTESNAMLKAKFKEYAAFLHATRNNSSLHNEKIVVFFVLVGLTKRVLHNKKNKVIEIKESVLPALKANIEFLVGSETELLDYDDRTLEETVMADSHLFNIQDKDNQLIATKYISQYSANINNYLMRSVSDYHNLSNIYNVRKVVYTTDNLDKLIEYISRKPNIVDEWSNLEIFIQSTITNKTFRLTNGRLESC